MKRLYLLLLLILAGLQAALAYDFSAVNEDGVTIYYNKTSDGGCAVTYKTTSYNSYRGSVRIPSSVKGYKVTAIGDKAFYKCSDLTSISIPNTITTIGYYTFANCTGLTSISLPNPVKSIGEYAFSMCSGLSSISLPNSLTTIGKAAFFATGLTSISLPNSVTSIGDSAFKTCTHLTSISLPNTVTSIGASAFDYCIRLTSITLPNSVSSIGNYAFLSCKSLTSISLPNSLTSIGKCAFANCTSLKSISIPNSVTSIGASAFQDCTRLSSVILLNSATSIGASAFQDCTSLTSISLSNSVTSIGASAFQGCTSLTSISLPNTVTSIGASAFQGCTHLTNISLPNLVKSISSSVFQDCTGLTSATLPNSVKSIGDSSFQGCKGLTSIYLPSSVTSIGDSSFQGCKGLTSVSLPNSVTSIGNSAFQGCSGLASITIPEAVTNIGTSAFADCSQLQTCNYNAINCSTMGSDKAAVFSGCQELLQVNIGNNVTQIPAYAFYGSSKIVKVLLGTSVKSIGTQAFYQCTNLKTIVNQSALNLSKGSTDYGYIAYYASVILNTSNTDSGYVFDYQNNVLLGYNGTSKNIVLPEDCNGNAYTIGDGAFSGAEMYSVTIPNKVTGIGANAFLNCPNLTSVTIGTGVLTMGKNAFSNCPNLYKVFLKGNTKPTGIESAFSLLDGRMTYVSNDKYTGISVLGNVKVYSSLTSMFEADGVKYIPVSMSGRTCEAIDCSYSPEHINIEISSSVLYRGIVFNVLRANAYALRNNPYIIQATLNMPSEVPDYLMADCREVKNLTVGGNITSFGKQPFDHMHSLVSLAILENSSELQINDNSIFRSGKLAELVLERDISYRNFNSSSPFSGMTSLRSLKIGTNVTDIGNRMFYATSVEAVVLPNSIISLGSAAFAECSSLSHVVLSNSLTAIQPSAFENCTGLQKIVFPGSITTIGNRAFMNTGLQSLRIPAVVTLIEASAFDGCNKIESIRFDDSANNLNIKCSFTKSGVKEVYMGRNIPQTVFKSCTSLVSVELSENVTQLPANAFDGCSALQVINLPSRLTEIKDYTFRNCSSLAGIEIPESVNSIGKEAFYQSGLPSITIGKTVTSIGESAFANCKKLQYASVAANTIGTSAFASSALRQVDIATDVNTLGKESFKNCVSLDIANIGASSIGASSFYGCKTLKAAVLDEKVKSIGISAFEGCSSLTTINVPEGNTSIAASCFKGTSSLSEIILPESIKSINANAFDGSGLNSIVIPSAVASIADKAFSNTKKLMLLTFNSSGDAITVANNAFSGTVVETANINRQLNYDTTADSPFAGCSTLRTVTMDNHPTSLFAGMFKNCKSLQTVRISEAVTEIGASAFYGCTSLVSVNIPAGVREIKEKSFFDCASLPSIELPGVTKICESAFANSGLKTFIAQPTLTQVAIGSFNGCSNLVEFVALSGSKTLELSNAASKKGLFADCPLKKVSVDRPIFYSILPEYGYSPFYRITTLQTVELGDYVPSVPANMFYGCTGLTDVVIGDGVTSFGKYAFSGCQSIQRFYFGGNVESIGEEAFSDCSAMIELWSQAVAPPVCGNQALADIDKWNCELIVPMGTVDAYAAADQWQDFIFTGESTGKSIMATGISLSKLSLNMKIDDQTSIMATILPTSVQDNFPVTWASSDESVAIVANGEVTAVGEGSCQIIASTQGNGIIMSACNVTVEKLDQELMWVQAFGAAYIGDKITFTGKADSNLDIHYEITGGDIIGELNGKTLYIKDVGSMEITAVQPGNNRYNPSNGVVRTITVIPINPKNIYLDNEVTVHVGQTMALTTQIEPLNAYDKTVTWRSMDESIVTVDETGKITGIYNGETYIVATASNGLMANCRVTVNSLGDDYLCIEDAEIESRSDWNIPIVLTNKQEISSVAFDVEIPSAMTFDTMATGYLEPTLTDRAEGYDVIANILDEHTAHIEIFAWGDKTFVGNSGEALVAIPVKVATANAPVIVKITNVNLYSATGELIIPGDDNAAITINSDNVLIGDVNDNGIVNTGDAVMVVNYAIGIEQPNFNEDAADVDGNGKINTGDAVIIVNYSIGLINEFPRKAPDRVMANSKVNLRPVNITGSRITMMATISTDMPLTAAEMSIDMPEGFEYVTGSLKLEGNDGHIFAVNEDNPSFIRFAFLSLTNDVVAPDNGCAYLTFEIEAIDEAPSYGAEIILGDICLVAPDGRTISAPDATYLFTQSELPGLYEEGCKDVVLYVENQTVHIIMPEAATAQLTDMNGHYVTYNLSAGHNTVRVSTPGFYIFNVLNKTYKIAIK